MEKHTLHVSIIGGGIGGLAAASALQRQGIQGTVFERNPELREIGVGLTLWTNGVHVLRQLGLACGHEQQTDLLVGADGLYSVIREQLLGKAPRAISATPGFRGVAFFEDAHDSPGISRETWGRGRRFGMLPIGNGRVFWYVTLNCPVGEQDREGGTQGEPPAPLCWLPPSHRAADRGYR